jgi:HD superfamily phosphohydrolase
MDYLTRDYFYLNLGYDTYFEFDFDYKEIINDVVVIDNTICYPHDKFNNLVKLFEARKYLHKYIVNDPIVISSQMIITNMIMEIDQKISITSNMADINFFMKLTDDFICNFVDYANLLCPEKINIDSENLINLTNKLKTMNFPKKILNTSSKKPINPITYGYNSNVHIFHKAVCGYVNDVTINPLNNVNLYKLIEGKNQIVPNTNFYERNILLYICILFEK